MGVPNKRVEKCLRKCLCAQGYRLNPQRGAGELGVDILARKDGEEAHIEVIGYSDKPPTRSRQFYEAFFRAISRLNQGASRCVIAVPWEFKRGLPQRAVHYGIAWRRIGEAFPDLFIWLVGCRNLDAPTYQVSQWNDWLT